MHRWWRGGGVKNGIKAEIVPNSELSKLACLDFYSCKTIIICIDVYVESTNKYCSYENKK